MPTVYVLWICVTVTINRLFPLTALTGCYFHWIHWYLQIDELQSLQVIPWLRWLVTCHLPQEALLQSQASPRGTHGGEGGVVTGFSPITSFFPVIIIPTLLHTHRHLNTAHVRTTGQSLGACRQRSILALGRRVLLHSVRKGLGI